MKLSIYKKKCLLLLTILPVVPVFYPDLDIPEFVIPVSFLSAYSLLFNFPSFIEQIHKKPLYYEDLETKTPPLDVYQKKFINITQVTMSLSVSSVVYYYFDQLHQTKLSKLEIFGVFGGYLSLLMKIERFVGSTLLSLMTKYKKNQQDTELNQI
jgi:hypothetical protein